MGGNTRRDGVTCLCWPSNVSSTSIEISEHIAPLRFHHKKLRPDSGGAGRHRGGLGQEILIESRSDTPIAVSFLAERTHLPGVRHRRRQGRRAGRASHQRQEDRSQEAVRREQGRHRLARHAGRWRPWRSAPADPAALASDMDGGLCEGPQGRRGGGGHGCGGVWWAGSSRRTGAGGSRPAGAFLFRAVSGGGRVTGSRRGRWRCSRFRPRDSGKRLAESLERHPRALEPDTGPHDHDPNWIRNEAILLASPFARLERFGVIERRAIDVRH